MPPPPPPSKSYLWVFDSDSSGSEGEENFHVVEKDKAIEAAVCKTDITSEHNPSVSQSSPSKKHPEEYHDSSIIPPKSPTTTATTSSNQKLARNQQKRKQKRKQRRKKKFTEESESNVKSRCVSFSGVSIRSFPRTFGIDTVPGHGGWPLGMKIDDHKDHDQVPLEEYETNKQMELRERWKVIQSTEVKESKCSSPSSRNNNKKIEKIDYKVVELMNGSIPLENTIYETRQWDYRNKVKNPLFGLTSEEERQALFLGGSEQLQMLRRSRSNSVGSSNHKYRSRSNSMGSNSDPNQSDNFNEEFNQALVHHVRNELEQLRIQRSKSGSTGCNCRKLNVYIPPKDGSGGKKSQHRRLKPSKLVQELKKRNLYDPSVASSSREKQEKILKKAMDNEPCCQSEDCFCFRNGIICQADACSCWHDSHVGVKKNHSLSSADIQRRCGNPLGTEVVDLEEINEYRIKVIKEKQQQQQQQ
ncbi:MAG: hypothetical protein ACI8RD_002378 [Bacillariaceae sp.]|jgi:hypothetical protein